MKRKNINSFFISKDMTIREALKRLDETAEKNLYIVNKDKQLMGAISDGDIRRAILRGINLEEKIDQVMNKTPKYIYEHELSKDKDKKIKKMILDLEIESVPVLNKDNQIVGIEYWVDVFKKNKSTPYAKKENKVFILAGGIGTRLEPFTKVLPKPLVPIGEQPIIEKIMDKFLFYGFSEFIISLNYKAEMIKLYFSDPEIKEKYSDIHYINEDTPLGTIGSLYLAKEKITDSFFITNSDILIEEDFSRIFDFHKESNVILTVVSCIKNSIIPYGVLNTDESGFLLSIEEKPRYKHVISTGVYVAEPGIVEYLRSNMRVDITELIDTLLKAGQKIAIYPIFEEQWFDIGQWAEYEKTRKYFEK